jgi:hypothetical protein
MEEKRREAAAEEDDVAVGPNPGSPSPGGEGGGSDI